MILIRKSIGLLYLKRRYLFRGYILGVLCTQLLGTDSTLACQWQSKYHPGLSQIAFFSVVVVHIRKMQHFLSPNLSLVPTFLRTFLKSSQFPLLEPSSHFFCPSSLDCSAVPTTDPRKDFN